jgi:hypothetical protein
MQKIALSAGFYASHYAIERPELDWAAIKKKLGETLKWYNEFVENNVETKLKKLAVSMEATALRILWIYMKKFSLGQVKNGVVKMTRSYLAGAVGVDFRTPAEVTISRHIDRFLDMPNSFIKSKDRSTLGIPGQDTNCLSLEIDRRIIVFKSEKHQKAHELGTEIVMQPTVPYKKTSAPVFQPQSPVKAQATPEVVAQEQARKSAPSSIGDIFSKFSNQPFTP